MTSEDPICCMVIAPGSPDALLDAAFRLAKQSKRIAKQDFERTTDWTPAVGTVHAGLYTRFPGSEGGDWSIAEIASTKLGDAAVYTAWFDSERAAVFEFRRGERVAELNEDPVAFVRGLGFDVVEAPPPARAAGHYTSRGVTVVQGATVAELRAVLGAERIAERALHVVPTPLGAAVHRGGDSLAREPSILARAFPERTVYSVTRDDDGFSVTVMREASDTFGVFRDPHVPAADALLDILGARTPAAILAALGITPSLLGYDS